MSATHAASTLFLPRPARVVGVRPSPGRPARVTDVGWADREETRRADAFRRRGPGSLEAVYAQHAPAVLGYLARALRDRAAAEDVLQEVFLDAWRRADTFDPTRASLRTWLLVIARSRAVDHLRRRVPEPRDTTLPGAFPDAEDHAADTDALLGQWRFAGLLARLSEEEARVLRMRFHLGLSQSEIAEQTGMPIGTVKTRMTRALARLRALMEAEGESP